MILRFGVEGGGDFGFAGESSRKHKVAGGYIGTLGEVGTTGDVGGTAEICVGDAVIGRRRIVCISKGSGAVGFCFCYLCFF